MNDFTPVSALLGGALIGIAASLMLALNGRITGISGILGDLLRPRAAEVGWRVAFLLGLVLGGALLYARAPQVFESNGDRSFAAVAVAGLLVGVGTRLGNGCTSGHGVCGIPRGSRRSIVATVTFIATGAVAVTLVRVLFGAAS